MLWWQSSSSGAPKTTRRWRHPEEKRHPKQRARLLIAPQSVAELTSHGHGYSHAHGHGHGLGDGHGYDHGHGLGDRHGYDHGHGLFSWPLHTTTKPSLSQTCGQGEAKVSISPPAVSVSAYVSP